MEAVTEISDTTPNQCIDRRQEIQCKMPYKNGTLNLEFRSLM
jgi:hypothetical protein